MSEPLPSGPAQMLRLAVGESWSLEQIRLSDLEIRDGVLGLDIRPHTQRSIAMPLLGPGTRLRELGILSSLPAQVSLRPIVEVLLAPYTASPWAEQMAYDCLPRLLAALVSYHQCTPFEAVSRVIARLSELLLSTPRRNLAPLSRLTLSLTQADLATICAVSRRTAGLELRKVSAAGWIDWSRGRLVIHLPQSWAALRTLDARHLAEVHRSIGSLHEALDLLTLRLMRCTGTTTIAA